jgi:hypothetical protein
MKKITFTKTEVNFANDLGYHLTDDLLNSPNLVTVANRFTGVSFQLPTLAKVLVDWIYRWSDRYEAGAFTAGFPKGQSIKQFDMARDLFRKMWPAEYMELLD